MVVAVFAWINALGLLLPSGALYALSTVISGALIAASAGLAFLLLISVATRRWVISEWPLLSVAWYCVALGWYPAGLVWRIVANDSPTLLWIVAVGVPVLFAAELIGRWRTRHAVMTSAR